MREVKLKAGGSKSSNLSAVLHELKVAKQRGVKLWELRTGYQTEFVFQTTSKDQFLGLGLFSSDGLRCLALLIQDELREAGDDENQCLFTLEDEESKGKRGFLVSRILNTASKVIFNLSPAH